MLAQQEHETDGTEIIHGSLTSAKDPVHPTISEDPEPVPSSPSASPSRWSSLFPLSIFTRQACLGLLYNCLLQTHSKLFDEFLPAYMQSKTNEDQSSTSSWSSIIVFSGGLNMSTDTSAIFLTAYGIGALLVQIFVFPPLARWMGVLKMLRMVSSIYPVIYFLTPYISKLNHIQVLRAISLVLLLTGKAFCGICAFPCSKILLSDSVPNKKVLGRLNGIATCSQQLVRAVVAIIVGKLFSVGLEKGLIILPWWTLGLFSLSGLVVASCMDDGAQKA